jgi:hypothetical protein
MSFPSGLFSRLALRYVSGLAAALVTIRDRIRLRDGILKLSALCWLLRRSHAEKLSRPEGR